MSTSFPDTNLPANYRPPSQPRRGNNMKREGTDPPLGEDEWHLANIFASLLEDELPLDQPAGPSQARPYYPSPPAASNRGSYRRPYIVAENTFSANVEDATPINESIIIIKRIRDQNKDGVIFFVSSRYRRLFFAVFIILLMAATGNLSEFIQFIVKYL